MIGALARVLEQEGIELVDSTAFLKPLVPEPGVLTRRAPDSREAAEMAYGREIARQVARLAGRLSDDGLSVHAMEEIAQTVQRVVDKLLHAPTVRVKELASSPGGEEYAAALRVLFDLNPRAVEAVTRAEVESPNATDQEWYL